MHDAQGLRGFLDLLRQTEDEGIAVVERSVKTEFELGTVVKKLENVDDRVVLFQNVEGHDMPVVINVFGTKARTALALGMDRDSTAQQTVAEFASRLDQRGATRKCAQGPVQEKVIKSASIDLGTLPVGVHAPEQGGKYINSGVFVVRDASTGALNGGIYRLMVQGKDTLTVSVDPGHDLGRIISRGKQRAEPVPFAIIIGADPAVYLASQAKVPMSRDLYDVVGALTGATVDLVECVSNDLLVPPSAEIVLEGHIVPGETAAEGPYGEFSYYYGSDPWATLCRIDAVTYRSDPIYMDLHPVHTEHRNLWLHPGREASLLAKLQSQVSDVTAAHLPVDGAGMVCVISIDKWHNGDSKRALMIAMASDVFIKHAVIVNDDVDITDPKKVLWALATRFQADRDIVLVPGVRGYAEDPSGYYDGDESTGKLTTKIGYDATLPAAEDVATPADILPEPYAEIDVTDYVTNPLR
ncbi:MAG: UbiD family decarboxylase [Pseudonocardiaceae bacterium]|nr:UbiD family decarboxylase [Pseudonocardiaceae bacterium]